MPARFGGAMTQAKRHRLYTEAGWRCRNCGGKFGERGVEDRPRRPFLTLDHIIPKAFGGPGERWNIAVLCSVCNNEKGDETWPHLFSLPVPPRWQMWVATHGVAPRDGVPQRGRSKSVR